MVKKFLSMVCVICVSVLCLSTVLGSQVLLNSQDAAAGINLGEVLLDVGDNIVSTIPDTIISTMLPGVAPVITGVNVIGDVVNLIDESGGGEILIDDSGSSGSSGGHSFGGGSTTAGDILPSAGVSGTTSGGGSDGGSSSGESFDCDKLLRENPQIGSIGAMQWILCPSLNNTIYTADMMDRITEGMLSVDSEMYNSSSYTANAWGIIRNIANVLMIVFLMVIIISQLTGRGIDNYGIKKMLPRLIVMAIIVNLSLYICQIAVDLSNILGVGLRDLIGSAANVAQQNGAVRAENPASDAAMGLFAIAGTGGTAAVGAGTFAFGTLGIAAAPAVAIGAIVLVLVVLVAIVILFLMLGARMAIVIACIILSPLAFAAFILPNTQNLFKKWWELFKAALVIFPLCGAVSGIAYMLRQMKNNMTFDTSTLGFYIILFILPYVGFFFLPMLLKNAISALGKLGAALTNAGNTIRNGGRAIGQGAMKVTQNSPRFKDWSQYKQEQNAAQRAKKIHDSLSGKTNLTRRQQDRLRKADDILLAQRKKTVENKSRANGEYYNAAMAKQDLAVQDEQRATQLYNDPNYRAMMEQHGQTTLLNEREKMWSEQYASQDKIANTMNLRNSLTGRDAEQAAAAFNTLNSQGINETMNELYNASWNTMDNGVREKLLARMSASNVDSFKSFAKYRQSGGQKSFKDWMNGAGPVEHNVKDATYALHIDDLKEHAMDTYSKDEMEFINKNIADSLRTQLGTQKFGSILKNAAIVSKDSKMQTQAEDIMRRQIENGNMSVEDLSLTAENLGSMRSDTLKAIRQGHFNNLQRQGYNAIDAKTEADELIRNGLEAEIAQAKSDRRIYNRMDNNVKSILGIAVADKTAEKREETSSVPQNQMPQTPAPQTGQPMPQPTPQPAQQTGQPASQPVQQIAQPTPQPTSQPTPPNVIYQPTDFSFQPPAVIVPPINPPASTASNMDSGQQNNFGNNIAEALRNNANSTADVASGLKNLRGAIENNNNSQVFEVRNIGSGPTGQTANNQNIVNNTNNITTNENNNLSAQFDASLRGLEANRFERIIPRGDNRRDNRSNNNNSNPDDNPSSNGESDS